MTGAGLPTTTHDAMHSASGAEEVEMIDIFTSGRDGYHTYRIPAIIVTAQGTVLAFAEGRRNSGSDTGEIDLLVKRSMDGGATWNEHQVVWSDTGNTCGNPCPVVDQRTGTIWLAMTHNPGSYHERDPETWTGTRTAWITRSDDDGVTWAEPREITATVKDPSWQWFATGPGIGIQLQRGAHAGRLVIPANYSRLGPEQEGREATDRELGAMAIVSDDGGQTWRRSRETIEPRMNESQVVELADGRVMLNMRTNVGDKRRRQAISDDGGDTWGPPAPADELVEPQCQGSILRLTWPDGGERSRLVFSNPASEESRDHLTVRLSDDEGASWAASKVIYEGTAAYSCLVALPDGRIGCLFERDRYKHLTLAVLTLDWLTDGRDTLSTDAAQ